MRRGMALLMVLLLLSVTLGLSYAAMRSLSTAGMIQRNSDRRAAARQAAVTGLAMALKKMHRSDWAGVDTSLTGSLSATETFSVTYTSGDPRVASTDADQPYRITLMSTGYSADPNQASNVAMYRVRAVVRFIPRQLADEPADWTNMMDYTVYQWTPGDFSMDLPFRIEGPVRIQATLALGWSYSWWSNPREQFFRDLNAMRIAKLGDYRPFTGPITWHDSSQLWWDTPAVLNTYLGVSTSDAFDKTVSGMTFPCTLSKYRLYPGGKAYNIPQLPRTIQGATYGPDPATNPAGLFYQTGPLDIGEKTTINGTIFTTTGSGGLITVKGSQISLNAVNLPALQGTTDPVQLPVAVVGNGFRIAAGTDLSIAGVVVTQYDFTVGSDGQAGIALTHSGKLVAQDVYVKVRTDWESKADYWWDGQWAAWKSQKDATTGLKYFPEWLQKKTSLNPVPQLTIKPDSASIRYHWHNPDNSIYVAHAADGGLRWDLLDWTENL
jgi:hypothetical protein